MSEDFDWNDVEDDIIIRSVGAVAIYQNPHGDVVIRQQGDGYISEDAVVVIPMTSLDKLIARLRDISKSEK